MRILADPSACWSVLVLPDWFSSILIVGIYISVLNWIYTSLITGIAVRIFNTAIGF
jgi:hypothetical protein